MHLFPRKETVGPILLNAFIIYSFFTIISSVNTVTPNSKSGLKSLLNQPLPSLCR